MDRVKSKIPKHIAVIMDGNGRWAEQRSLDRIDGHRQGVESLRAVVRAAVSGEVEYLTVYAFSTENWGRPTDEVRGIMELFSKVMLAEAIDLAKHKVRLRFIGAIEELSDQLQIQIADVERIEIDRVELVLTVAINYSARWDIVRAAKRLTKCAEVEIDEKVFAKQLSTAFLPDVDLVIRTSGEWRLSNFLLWESSYAELYFTQTLWPDFSTEEFQQALDWYALRDRRYGLTQRVSINK